MVQLTKKRPQLRIRLNPKTALPKPEDLYLNIPSGSGGALQVGVNTDVRKKMYFIGKEGTEIEDTHYTAVDLGGTYVGSKNVTGFTYNKNEYVALIDNTYVSGSAHIGMFLPEPYSTSFPTDENSWTVGKMG